MPVTITETDAFPNAVQMPVAGELASAPGLLSQLVQGTINRTRWLYNRIGVFVNGGTLTPSASVNLQTPTTAVITVNGVTIASPDDGSAVTAPNNATFGGILTAASARVFGFVRTGLRVSLGNTTAGVHTYTTDNFQHIYAVAGPSIGAGCTWQIDDSTSFGQEWFRFVNFNASQISINNPAGVLLQNIKFGNGFAYAITVARLSGTWTVIDAAYTP